MTSSIAYDTMPLFGDLDNPFTEWTAWVEYDGLTDNLSVFFNNEDTKPLTSVINYQVDLATVLNSDSAFVGFSAATGHASADHRVTSFDFSSDFVDSDTIAASVTSVPEPGSLVLLGLGMLGFAAARRKKSA